MVCALVWTVGSILVAADEPTPDASSNQAHSAAPEVLTQLSDRIISGNEPHSAANFAYLQDLGVKTIISVDGVKPNAKAASQYGLRYVHIPIGYDGISQHAQESLTRAVQETTGLIYVHCHHGKHRGPAAAAIACRVEHSADATRSLKIMQDAGTSKDYKGLWRDVQLFRLPPANKRLPDLVEFAEVESMAAAMARLSRRFDNLQLCRTADWKPPATHPDLEPTRESLQVQEGLHEALRTISDDYNTEFRNWLAESNKLATELHSALQSGSSRDLEARFKLLEGSCRKCHARYRN